jgi:hypothetical protein
MIVLLTLVGAGMILIALRDIFHELLHPSGTGSISSLLMRTGWRPLDYPGRPLT